MITPDEYQNRLNRPIKGDDNPPNLTSVQLQKAAAILHAHRRRPGSVSDRDADLAHKFLVTAAEEGREGKPNAVDPCSAIWERLKDVPWPRPDDPTNAQ